ncbi:Neoverrucotoxin subunit beta [Labeo rohita]|uniref:Neoverrucotoxin subunit beta n=1 Tax=Labeo rohita TaxID=84645 RepID=A0ABQ8M7P9_LABRO|nr:Neoverrucotoxin subunit beta [Labeo rohita]
MLLSILEKLERNVISATSHMWVFFARGCPLASNFIALTFDSQTANDHLYLKENNTVVTCQTRKQQLPANDERFDKCNQVLCCQPLIGRCFFIVDVTGPVVHVGVACKGIKRKGKGDQVHLGRNKMSWSLRCSKMCEVHHNKHAVSVQSESIRKLGVFVDRNAGSVCFYMLSPQYKLLYMFDADFPEDQELYAAFKIQEPNSSVTLNLPYQPAGPGERNQLGTTKNMTSVIMNTKQQI